MPSKRNQGTRRQGTSRPPNNHQHPADVRSQSAYGQRSHPADVRPRSRSPDRGRGSAWSNAPPPGYGQPPVPAWSQIPAYPYGYIYPTAPTWQVPPPPLPTYGYSYPPGQPWQHPSQQPYGSEQGYEPRQEDRGRREPSRADRGRVDSSAGPPLSPRASHGNSRRRGGSSRRSASPAPNDDGVEKPVILHNRRPPPGAWVAPTTSELREILKTKGLEEFPPLPVDRSKIWHESCGRVHAPEFCRGPMLRGCISSCVLCGRHSHLTDDCMYYQTIPRNQHHALDLYLYMYARQSLPPLATKKSFQLEKCGQGNTCLVPPLSPVTARHYEGIQMRLDKSMNQKLYWERFEYRALRPVETELQSLPPKDPVLGQWKDFGPLPNLMADWVQGQYLGKEAAAPYEPKWTLFANDGIKKPNGQQPVKFPDWVLSGQPPRVPLLPQSADQDDDQYSSESTTAANQNGKRRKRARPSRRQRKLRRDWDLLNLDSVDGARPSLNERGRDLLNLDSVDGAQPSNQDTVLHGTAGDSQTGLFTEYYKFPDWVTKDRPPFISHSPIDANFLKSDDVSDIKSEPGMELRSRIKPEPGVKPELNIKEEPMD